ncbi:Cytochrome P450, partial [Operophtera brumata]
HGDQWRRFRSKVQRPILQPQTVKKYVAPIERVTEDFIKYMEDARDELGDLPHDDSETQRIIDAAKYALRNVAVLELKAPYWRYIPTPLWTKYVNNMNFFVE